MKKVTLLIISLLLFVSINVSAKDNASSMLDTIQELSLFPRGFKNIEIENARELIKHVFLESNLEINEQIFPTFAYDDNGNQYYGKNIIGTLYPNTETKTKDILIIGAHYDGVNNMPAANDNASGVAVMLELAKKLADYKTDTEIRFVAFDCEEIGLIGSEYYANSITEEAENIIGMLNFDMLASNTAGEVFVYSNENSNYLYDILKSKAPYQDVFISSLSENGLNVASDYVSFKPKLIPTLSFSNITISEETHTEKDVFENISAEMLLYSYNAGLSIIEEIIEPQTVSYKNDIAVDKKVYTIHQDTTFPFGVDKKAFEESLNIQFNPIISKTNQMQYKATVNMFDINEPLELIIEETPLQSSEIDQSITECIVNIDSIDLFDKIYNSLNIKLGNPEITNSNDRYTYLWNDLIYGNSYYCVKEMNNIKLYIRECLPSQKGFFVCDGNIIETTEVYPRDKITIFNNDGKIDYIVENASVLKDAEVGTLYISAWEKIKQCLSDMQLSKLKYIILCTDGVDKNADIFIEEALPIQHHIDDLLTSDKHEKQALTDGVLLIADYMDIIYGKGDEKQLEYNINCEWIRRKNGSDIPSIWSINIVDEAIKRGVLNSTMLCNFREPICRADICDILYNFFLVNNKIESTTEFAPIFTDIDRESVNFFADIGIVNGVGGNLFIPDGLLTREQAAVILARVADYFGIEVEHNINKKYYDDDYISKWAKDSVSKMCKFGVMIGNEKEYFNPQDNCTKEEMIVAIMRINKLF